MLRHKSQMLGLVPVMRHSEVANSIVEGSSPVFLRGSHRGFLPTHAIRFRTPGQVTSFNFMVKLHLI